MIITNLVMIAWFAGLLFVFHSLDQTQVVKGGSIVVDRARQTRLMIGLGAYLLVSAIPLYLLLH